MVTLAGLTVTLSRSSLAGDEETFLGESESAIVGEGAEFTEQGPYVVDVSDASISMKWNAENPQWHELERVLEEGTAEIYALTFDSPALEGLPAGADDGSALRPKVSVVSAT